MTQNTVQSAYSRYTAAAGAAGAFATMSGWDADSRILESASAGFGLAVSQGVEDNAAILGGPTFVGITIRDVTLVHDTPDRYEEGDTVGVAVRGDIWVVAAGAVEVGLQAYYNSSTGAVGGSGISNAVAIAGAKFLDTGAEGDLVRVRLSNAIGDLTT